MGRLGRKVSMLRLKTKPNTNNATDMIYQNGGRLEESYQLGELV